MSEKKPLSLDDIDNFWDLNSLLPQKRPVSPRRAVTIDTVEIDVDSDSPRDAGAAIPKRETRQPAAGIRQQQSSSQPPSQSSVQPQPQSTSQSQSPPTAADSTQSTLTSPRDENRRIRELPLKMRAQQNEPKILEPYLVYEPDSSIIKRVSVSKWQTRYNFYEKFASDAARLWNRTSGECDNVPFFSYIPQYNQLSYTQLKWYLCWREKVRNGVYPRCDYSYILLYIYEILNSPDLIEPARGLEKLCDIWLAYRGAYQRIDSYLGEWVCDYCLINQLPCPHNRLEPIIKSVITASSFKEFYMDTPASCEGAANILAFSSNYDWRSSRYVTPETLPVFSRHINRAFEKIYSELLSDDGMITNASPAVITRDAYSGALCVYDRKRSIKVEYISYTRSTKFRFIVTDIIKYCENRVRMALGIKARLKVENLTDELRACLDEYFDRELPAKQKKPKAKTADEAAREAELEYERLYEPVGGELSLENALAIERDSWSTTEILTRALADSETAGENTAVRSANETSEPYNNAASTIETHEQSKAVLSPQAAANEYNDEIRSGVVSSGRADGKSNGQADGMVSGQADGMVSGQTDYQTDDEFARLIRQLDANSLEALKLLASGDRSGLSKAAAKASMLADALVDRINETSFDIIGDSIIEPDADGYRLIADYEGDIAKWLK